MNNKKCRWMNGLLGGWNVVLEKRNGYENERVGSWKDRWIGYWFLKGIFKNFKWFK